MSIFQKADDIKLLQNLLNPQSDSDSDDDYPPSKSGARGFGPGDICPQKLKPIEEKPEESKALLGKIDDEKDDLQKWLEKQEQEDSEALETRPRPEYKVTFKQAIRPEDLYLQMNNKTASSSSCEDMIIEISMPDETVGVENMDLKVTDTLIDLKSPKYRLKLPLMHKINPDRGNAKFDSDRKVLLLTLRIQREYDFVNF